MATSFSGFFDDVVGDKEKEKGVAPSPTSEFSDFFADVRTLTPAELDPLANDTVDEKMGRRVQQFVKGAAEPLASVPEAIELGLRGIQNATGIQGEARIEDTAGFKLGENIRGVQQLVGEPDPRDKAFWGQVAQGLGNVVGMAPAAIGAGMVTGGVGAFAVAAGQGASMNAVQLYKEARDAGADEDVALSAAAAGALVGSTEAIPIFHALKLLPPPVRTNITNSFVKALVHIGSSAGEEGVQEYLSQVANNMIAKDLYDPDRGWNEDGLENFLVGTVVGLVPGAAGAMRRGKSKPKVNEIEDTGPDAAETEALREAAKTVSEPSTKVPNDVVTVAPDEAAALETPAQRARRIARERLTKMREQAPGQASEEVAEPVAEPVTAEVTEEAAPGADTALSEEIPDATAPTPEGTPFEQPVPEHPVPEQVDAAPTPEVTTEVTPDAAPEETIPTVPEAPETLEAQQQALVEGKRAVVFYPIGTATLPFKAGKRRIARMRIEGVGVLDYDTRALSRKDIESAAKAGELNEFLGLGPSSKADVAESIDAGSPETAVTERTPDGLEVKAAASTEALAPETVAAFEAQKAAPENTVATEPVQNVIQDRLAAQDSTADLPTPLEAPGRPIEVSATQVAEDPQTAAQTPSPAQETAPIVPAEVTPVPPPKSQVAVEVSRRRTKPKKIAPKGNLKDDGDVMREHRRAEEAKRAAAERKAEAERIVREAELKKKAKPSQRVEDREMLDLQADEDRFRNQENKALRKRDAEEADGTADEVKGKNWTKDELKDRAAANAIAEEIAWQYGPSPQMEDIESAVGSRGTAGQNARAVIQSRAEAMIEAANKAGLKLPNRLKSATAEQAEYGDGIALLLLARDLLRVKNPTLADILKFVTREKLVRAGFRREVIKERSAEAGAKKKPTRGEGIENIADTTTVAALAPKLGDEDVVTSRGKSATMGVRGINSEGAASGDKLAADAARKAALMAEYAAKLLNEAKLRIGQAGKLSQKQRGERLKELLEMRARELGADFDEAVQRISNGEPIEGFLAISHNKAARVMKNIRTNQDGQSLLQKTFYPAITKRMGEIAPDVTIMELHDEAVGLLAPGANAYYSPNHDIIVVKSSIIRGYDVDVNDAHVLVHEMAHAVMFHALHENKSLQRSIKDLMGIVKANTDWFAGQEYGFTNPDEFLAEAFSNPGFQAILARTPVSREWWSKSGLPQPKNPVFRNVLNWLKATVAKLLGVRKEAMQDKDFPDRKYVSAFSIAMDVGGALMEVGPDARSRFYEFSIDTDEIAPLRHEEAPTTVRGKLEAAGLDPSDAAEIEALINEEFGGTITDAELKALAEEFVRPITSEGNIAEKVAAAPPGGKDVVKDALSDHPKRKTKTSAFLLKLMTLDYIRQRYGHLFEVNGERHLDTFIKGIQKREAIVDRVAQVHEKDASEFMSFARANPVMADQMAALAMDATRHNVNLGANADNSHLGKNAKMGLQAKAQLADLNARYDALSDEARELFDRMVANYRTSHNAAKTKLAENVLDTLDLPLTAAQRADLVQKVVDGKLTDADKATVGSPTIYRALKNAAELQAIKGAYFPQMRFGDHVVVTTEAIAKPTVTSVTARGNPKPVPVQTEVDGNIVRFTADQSTRGVGAALDRVVSDYVANSDLKVLRVSRRWRDRATGEIVATGEQQIGHDYDLTYEVALQNKGVHYFEKKGEAEAFRKASKSAKTSEVLPRRHDGTTRQILEGTDLSAITKRIESRNDLSESSRKAMKQALEEAVVASMPGNRSPARYQARRNVLGASQDIGRAAATYGRAQGNFMAMLETAPEMREAMKKMGEVERQVFDQNNPAVQMVLNELRARVETIDSPDKPNQLMRDISTLSFFDKLVSPAYSAVNATQVLLNTLPVLGGRYGNVRTSVALTSAYNRMGAIGTLGRGALNVGRGFKHWRDASLDTSNLMGSVRKKLGPKYDDLLNELIARGAVDADAGLEIAQAIAEGSNPFRSNMARFDRAVRQMPAAVEAVNRVVTAVATYDLATQSGKSEAVAIEEAFDTVMDTQGDYRASNTPRFMKRGLLSFAMQFRKYALLQTQLYADMAGRVLNGATPKERMIAGKQLMNLMAMQVLLGGAIGLPGLEVIKLLVMMAGLLGLTDAEWEDFENGMQDAISGIAGDTWGQLISKGVVTQAIGIDFSTRISHADLWTGFAPDSMDAKGLTKWLGNLALGAPGQMLVEWATLKDTFDKKGPEGVLEKAVPIKLVADTVKAVTGVGNGKLDGREAVLQALGFKSASAAARDQQDQRDRSEKFALKAEATKLREEYKKARTGGERARIKSKIREYNRRKKPEGVTNINLDRLVKDTANEAA